jgi:hypothetical protein
LKIRKEGWELLLECWFRSCDPPASLLTLLRLAKSLYASNSKFLYELLQNAEDNSYSRARFTGAKPYIKFTIRPRQIVIDSNEDGFTTENVRAICKIGESSKTRGGEQYFIGENGIGFKSVFMVAPKVNIQSGPFSLPFEHKPREQGMGMITPKWEPSDVVLAEPLTRITLTLLDSLNLDDLLSQFDDLPRTLLLFMKKLDRIIIDADLRDVDESAMKPNTRVRSIITYSSGFNQITGKAKITVSMDAIERLAQTHSNTKSLAKDYATCQPMRNVITIRPK